MMDSFFSSIENFVDSAPTPFSDSTQTDHGEYGHKHRPSKDDPKSSSLQVSNDVPIPILEDSTEPTDEPSMGAYFRVFLYNDRIGWATNAVAFVCMIAAGVLLPLMDVVFGKIVTVFNDFVTGIKSPNEFRSSINHYTLYFVYLFVAKFGLVYVGTTIISINAIRVTRALRIDLLKQTLRQEIAYFDSSATGSISSTITNDANTVNQGISEKLGLTIQALSTFLSAFVVAFAVQWKLTLITLCIIPTILIVISICVMIDTRIENKLGETWARADGLAEEVFASVRIIHAFGAQGKMSAKFEAIVDDARAIGKRKPPIYAVMFCVQFFCIYAGYGLAFWQGIRMYNRGEIKKPGTIVTVIFAVILVAQGLTQIAPQIMTISKATASAQNIFRVIDRRSHIDALSTEGAIPPDCHGHTQFDNVHFAYPSRPDVPVLRGLKLDIPANKTTAIVGASGCGKSTVVGLLERWYSVQGGAILLDGQRIEDVNVRWLRTTIRAVQQEPVLFNGTIFQNIAYGLAGTPQADLPDGEKYTLVENACKSAYAHDFITSFPQGYNTQIGERGAMLSGGQKQRLAIARCIISNPRVLLLDEATSALDTNAEQIVQKALNNISVGRTTVVIAHRLSTIRDADNIVVMSQGTIIEQGTHRELIQLGGKYSRLVLAQDLGQESGRQETSKEISSEGPILNTPSAEIASEPHDEKTDLEAASTTNVKYSLLRSLAIIVTEQRCLWPAFIVIAIGAAIGGASYPALAVLFSRALSTFSLTGTTMLHRGDFYALMFLALALANLAGYFALGWASSVVAQEIMAAYRLDLFAALLRQDIAFFDDPDNTTGALVSRLATEPAALEDLLSSNIALMLTILVNLVSSNVLAIATGWKLGLALSLGALPLLVAAGYVRMRLELQLDDDTVARFARSAGVASEAVRAIRTVAALALEPHVLDTYEASLRRIARTSSQSLVRTMVWYSLCQSFSFLAMALGFWYGGRLVADGTYSARQFYTVFVAVIFSGEAAAGFFTYTSSITKAQGAASYVWNMRAHALEDVDSPEPPETPGRQKGVARAARVDVSAVTFSYPRRPQTSVLNGLSTTIQPGQFIALVGPSGCGKTTALALLERFYDPTTGTITLDHIPSTALPRAAHRRPIALVPQDPILYGGSLRENIALGLPAAPPPSDAQILVAARQAHLADFVASLPDGLATHCGPMGTRLSGGQRQRVALALALVRQPRLLLLDEATSSLDGEAERAVQAALEEAAKGTEGEGGERSRTTVAVAHRLATVKGADEILVLERGRIVERGSHEELVARRGRYYQMCLGQALDA